MTVCRFIWTMKQKTSNLEIIEINMTIDDSSYHFQRFFNGNIFELNREIKFARKHSLYKWCFLTMYFNIANVYYLSSTVL